MQKKKINNIIHLWKDYKYFFDKEYTIKNEDFKHENSIFRIGNDYSFMVDIASTKILKITDHFFSVHDTKEKPVYLGDFLNLVHPEDLEFIRFAENWGLEKILELKEKNTYKLGYVVRMKGEDGRYELFYHQTFYKFGPNGKIRFCIHHNTKFKHFKAPLKYLAGILDVKTNEFVTHVRYDFLTNDISTILSKRQMDFVSEILKGLTDKEIADKLFISYNTARTHRRNIHKKLGAKNTAELIKVVNELGVV